MESSTAKGQAVAVSVADGQGTQITGDPFHDVLALRRVTPARMPDAATLVRDHIDALGRLSAPEEPSNAKPAKYVKAELVELDSNLHPLLLATVADSKSDWLKLGSEVVHLRKSVCSALLL